MSNIVNWKKIGLFATVLLLAEILVGFITGGRQAAELRIVASYVLSLCFSSFLFWLMGKRQSRPFLHAGLALLLTFVLTVALGAILPAWLAQTSLILAVLDWLTLALGLIIGTSIARYVTLRKARAGA